MVGTFATSPPHKMSPSHLPHSESVDREQLHGQMLMYWHHLDSYWMCPTHASLNIVWQAHLLDTPHNHPAAVYCDSSTGLRCQITAKQVTVFLRHVAHKVFYILSRSKDLLAWSCHSICITAMNLLRQAQFSNSYIKNRLCQRSDTFLMYLHNTFYMANRHTKAITLGLDPPTPVLA